MKPHMMIQHLLEIDVTNEKHLTYGLWYCHSAILAEMKGAQPIDAIDIDNWCYLNSIEMQNTIVLILPFAGEADIT
jgi:ribosomal protein L11 methyltransferase